MFFQVTLACLVVCGLAQANVHNDIVNLHNSLRARHGVGPVTLNSRISAIAQKWAEHLAQIDRMEHSDLDASGLGENIAYSTYKDDQLNMVQRWYDEIKDYDYNDPDNSVWTRHFSQLVWKESKEIGVGEAKNPQSGKNYVVVNYSPRGNWIGEFPQNVPRPLH